MGAPTFPPGTFTPAPGRGRVGRMLFTHARTEVALTLRNSEQILLTLLIPVALLVGLTVIDVFDMPRPRVDSVAPRVFALAVMSSAFTGQAIALGFDRRYGVLKRLAATALPRWLLVSGRATAGLVVVALQLVVLAAIAAALGWAPHGLLWALALVVVGTLSFGALGVLLAGGIVVPATSMPGALADVVPLLPSGALTEGLRVALVDGATPDWSVFAVLFGWGAAAALLATRTTKLS